MSKVTGEIVTLQFGHYSNFVGTHWWNIQNSSFVYHPNHLTGSKEINNDVLFRVGENLMHEVTYTPRLIIFDLERSLNTLKETGTLYDIETDSKPPPWSGKLEKYEVGCSSRNEFLQDLDHEEVLERKSSSFHPEKDKDETEAEEMAVDESKLEAFGPKVYHLDESVTVWSDFLRPHLHPKTLEVVRNFQHGNELDTFDVFEYGVNVYKEQQDEIEDRLHFFAEECDNLEGFLLLVDSFNGFGGLASSFVSDLLDDYRKKSVMIYSVSPATFPAMSVNREHYRLLNVALSYDHLLSSSSIFIPLSTSASTWKDSRALCQFPHVKYKPNLPYHTSALLATAIDTMTLPFRLENGSVSMTDLTSMLTTFGRKLMSVHGSIPLPIDGSGSLFETLSSGGMSNLLQSLTPHVHNCVSSSPFCQYVVCRGEESPGVPSSLMPPGDETMAVNSLLQQHLEKNFKTGASFSYAVRQPCKVFSPYPNIFLPNVTTHGRISSVPRPSCQGVQSIPVMTLIQSSSSGRAHLEALHAEVRKLKLHKMSGFTDAGLESDEFVEMLESLKSEILRYEDNAPMDVN